MDFIDLKKKIEKELPVEKLDFIPESSNNLSLGYLEINPTQRLIFSVQEFRGKKYFDIRTWYQADSGEWKPTKKGVHLSFDKFEDFNKMHGLFSSIIPMDT